MGALCIPQVVFVFVIVCEDIMKVEVDFYIDGLSVGVVYTSHAPIDPAQNF